MNVVDSSAWLEYFADGPNAGHFAAAIEDTSALVVPSIHNCQVSRLDGSIDAASVTNLDVTCVTGISFTDRFEALAPADHF